MKIISTNLKQVVGRDIILVDDMISSGGSIIRATEFLKKQKCKRVYVSCTHALLVGDAEKRIKLSRSFKNCEHKYHYRCNFKSGCFKYHSQDSNVNA